MVPEEAPELGEDEAHAWPRGSARPAAAPGRSGRGASVNPAPNGGHVTAPPASPRTGANRRGGGSRGFLLLVAMATAAPPPPPGGVPANPRRPQGRDFLRHRRGGRWGPGGSGKGLREGARGPSGPSLSNGGAEGGSPGPASPNQPGFVLLGGKTWSLSLVREPRGSESSPERQLPCFAFPSCSSRVLVLPAALFSRIASRLSRLGGWGAHVASVRTE